MTARQGSPRRVARLARGQLLAALCLIAVANGAASQIVRTIVASGFWPALARSFDFSVITVAGTALGVHLAWTSQNEAADRLDLASASLACLLILLPHRAGSWAAVAVLGCCLALRTRPPSALVPAGVLFMLVSASAFWCGVAAQLFAVPVLSWDAALGAGALRLAGGVAAHRGNLIVLDGQEPLVVLAGCSSLMIAGHAVLCWATITFARRPSCQWSDLAGMIAIAVVAVLLNSARLALMGVGTDAYEWAHGPVGASFFNVGVLLSAAALAFYTAGMPQPRR